MKAIAITVGGLGFLIFCVGYFPSRMDQLFALGRVAYFVAAMVGIALLLAFQWKGWD